MVMVRVDSIWTGPSIRGGGITQLFFGEGGGTSQDAVNAVQTFWGAITGYFAENNFVEVDPVTTILNEEDGSLEGVASTSTSGPIEGNDSGDPLPVATQGLVRWFTGGVAGNRLVRGRTFLPAMVETNNTAGVPVAGFITAIETAANALISDAETQFGIWHRPTGPALVDGSFNPVVATSCWNEWASLRSRRD